FRTALYLPAMTPLVASAVLWARVFNADYGLLNDFIGLFGVPPQRWLFQPELAKPAIILMGLWHVGPQMVSFLAGPQAVPSALLGLRRGGALRWASSPARPRWLPRTPAPGPTA